MSLCQDRASNQFAIVCSSGCSWNICETWLSFAAKYVFKILCRNNSKSQFKNQKSLNWLITFCLPVRYFKAGSEACDLLHRRELFSFGSGHFYDGRDALDLIEADNGDVLPVSVNFETLIILDKKKALGHLSTMPCIDKPVPLKELLQSLEDNGEAILFWLVFAHFWKNVVMNLNIKRWICKDLLRCKIKSTYVLCFRSAWGSRTTMSIWPWTPLKLKNVCALGLTRKMKSQRKRSAKRKRKRTRRTGYHHVIDLCGSKIFTSYIIGVLTTHASPGVCGQLRKQAEPEQTYKQQGSASGVARKASSL